nr:inositol monophosphatase family protein [uncultured Sphingosinicella sp.]
MTATSFTDFALALADAARGVTMSASVKLTAEDKNGGGAFDPVTESDRGAERAMRALIEYRHPNHGIRGEEYPERRARGRYVWSLDPIDGTRSFLCGLPSWTTLIALLDEGKPVLGLIDAPRMRERFLGTPGGTRLLSDKGEAALKTSGCTRLDEARFTTTNPYLFEGAEKEAFETLRAGARLTLFGHDAYGYARVAAGTVDLVAESGLKPHDYNALIPVVRGAGGVIGNWRGEDEFSAGQVVAAATQELFDEAVGVLKAAAV